MTLKMGGLRLAFVMIAVALISVAPRIDYGTVYGADSVTVSATLLDSTVAYIDRLEYRLDLVTVERDSALAVLGMKEPPLALPDSFWRKWYVWATLYGLGVLTGVLVR